MSNMPKKALSDPGKVDNNKVRDIFNRIKNLETKGVNVINFAIGASGFKTPLLIQEAAKEALKSDQHSLIPLEGLTELRMEICDYIDRTRGFRPKLDQILIGPTVKTMFFTTLLTLITRGDEVISTDPGKPSYTRLTELLGGKVKYVPCSKKDNFKIDSKKLESLIGKKTKVIILTTPHNPTGYVVTTPEVQKISELAKENNTIIVSDETFNQIIFKGRHVSPTTVDRAKENTILIESLSYTFSMAGWKLGFILASQKIIKAFKSVMIDTLPPVPRFIQYASIEALRNADRLMPDILSRYKKCCRALVDGLQELPGFKCQSPIGGIYTFPDISGTGRTSTELAEFLLENAGIAVLPGDVFGKRGKNHLRLSFATSIENINEGLVRLEESF